MTNLIKAVSFFAGAGLMDYGAKQAGIQIAFANEFNKKFAPYHAANFQNADGSPVVTVKPIHEVTKDEILKVLEDKYGDTAIDIVCGGPPCQGYTKLNTGRLENGSSSRNSLVLEFLRKVEELNPKIAVMEEVPDFLIDKVHYPLFLKEIGKMNYVVKSKVMCALNYEGNSIRERAIFLFVRKDLGKQPVFPKPIPGGIKMCGEFLDIDSYTSGHFDDRLRYANEPMTTVTSGSPTRFFKNGVARKPTEREIMLCQSLDPDSYMLPKNHSYSTFRKVMGNGVPTGLARNIFRTIMDEILLPASEKVILNKTSSQILTR